MPVYWDASKKCWRFTFNRIVNGVRYRSTKRLPRSWSRHRAEAFDRQESGRLYAEARGLESPRLPLAGAVALYVKHRCPELRNGRKAAQDLAQLSDEIERAWLDQVDELATEYEKTHRATLAPGTIRNRLAYLRAAVRYARKVHKYGKGLPDASIDMVLPSADNERQVYARLPELNRLWRAIEEPEARALFKMVFYMGLRWRAELLPRVAADVHRNGEETWLQIGVTKNGRPVMKPVHPAARASLKFIPFQHGDSWFYDQWRAAVAKIGRPDLHPHDLRHSLASEILSRPGGTLDDVRAALHHVSVQAADRYAHLYPERMRDIIYGIGVRKNAPPSTFRKNRKVHK
jgi:integrase